MNETERTFEEFIEAYLTSEAGGWQGTTDAGYCSEESRGMSLDIVVLTDFVKSTQPMAWKRFERMCTISPVRQFYKAFENAVVQDGLISVLRHGFKHRGINFRVCYFKPESELNELAVANYQKNVCHCIRQWHYSEQNKNSIDMMLAVNGIPVVAVELKNQLTGQSVDDAMRQWAYNRNPKEPAFGFNKRILAYFACDLYNVYMTTRLEGATTRFLPFNQGSNGAGNDGGAGNPQNASDSYVTSYFWEAVLQKDSLMDILQKFISYEKTEKKETMPDGSTNKKVESKIIFPRYHQLDVVRELVKHVRETGSGHNYLIQHSAGSGKSNSIAWTAYRLASLHDSNNEAIFNSVIIVTDRRVLDAQLQATVSSFDHTETSVRKPRTRSVFTGVIRCPKCGKSYRQVTSNGSAGWNCATYQQYGKSRCFGKKIPDDTLRQVTVDALGLSAFEANAVAALIHHIEVPEPNRLIYFLKDGSLIEREWQDRTRRDSWTDEMKQTARDRALKQRRKK